MRSSRSETLRGRSDRAPIGLVESLMIVAIMAALAATAGMKLPDLHAVPERAEPVDTVVVDTAAGAEDAH